MNPILGGLISVLIFSFGTLLIVFGREFPPFQFGTITYFLGFLSIVFIQKARGKLDISNWKQPPIVYFTVFLGMGAYSTLLMVAFNMGSAFAVNVLNYTWPIFWVLLSAAIHKKIPKSYQIAGLLMGFLGMILVFAGRSEELSTISPWNIGYILAIIASIVWACYSVFSLNMSYKSDFLAPVILLSGFVTLVLHLVFEETVLDVSPTAWMAVTVIGLSRCVYVLWDYCIRRGDTVILSSMAYFTPLLSSIWFICAGLVPQNAFIAIAGILIISGCLITNTGEIMKALKRMRGSNNAAL